MIETVLGAPGSLMKVPGMKTHDKKKKEAIETIIGIIKANPDIPIMKMLEEKYK